MSFEIERKFLVANDAWKDVATSHTAIRQAYLSEDGKASVRVRIRDGKAALTIKSRGAGLRRLELEYQVPVLEAEAMLALRSGAVIEKERYIIPWHGLAWEVDVFRGDNAGLTIAEIELPTEHHPLELPPWIGAEVTGQAQYYNSHLARTPFRGWSVHAERSKANS
jgi:adenylate cyclase